LTAVRRYEGLPSLPVRLAVGSGSSRGGRLTMATRKIVAVFLSLAYGIALSIVLRAQPPIDAPRYVSATELARPADYREWVFLSSGLGMAYNAPNAGAPPTSPSFTNIFVNPSSYRTFVQTGTWPDKTMLVLESRASGSATSINKAGRFQTNITSLEVEVKDTSRFPPNGWAFFMFGAGDRAKSTAAPVPKTFDCYECHSTHTALDNTFVQFYPTLLEIARQKGTLKPGF
jgi:hypothetical protein